MRNRIYLVVPVIIGTMLMTSAFGDPTAPPKKVPKPSFVVLRCNGEKLNATWHGLAVKKKRDQSLDSLIQPGTGPGKDYVFTK